MSTPSQIKFMTENLKKGLGLYPQTYLEFFFYLRIPYYQELKFVVIQGFSVHYWNPDDAQNLNPSDAEDV